MRKKDMAEYFNACGEPSAQYKYDQHGNLWFVINEDYDVDIYPAHYSGLSSRDYSWLDVWYQKREIVFPRMAVNNGDIPNALSSIIKILKKANYDPDYIYFNFNILDLSILGRVLFDCGTPYQHQLKGYKSNELRI